MNQYDSVGSTAVTGPVAVPEPSLVDRIGQLEQAIHELTHGASRTRRDLDHLGNRVGVLFPQDPEPSPPMR